MKRVNFQQIILILLVFTISLFSNAQDSVEGKRIAIHESNSDMKYYETYVAYNSSYYFKFYFKAEYVDASTYKYRLIGAKINMETGKSIDSRYICTFKATNGGTLWNQIAMQSKITKQLSVVKVLSTGQIAVAGDHFFYVLSNDLTERKKYHDSGQKFTSIVEDVENSILIASYEYNSKQVGTMIVHLDTKKNEWNEPSFEPKNTASDRTFPLKNDKVVKVVDRYSSSHDNGVGSYGQRVFIQKKTDLSIVEKTLDLGFYASHPDVNKNGILVGNDSEGGQAFVQVYDLISNKKVKKILINGETDGDVDHIVWKSDQLFEVYQTKTGRDANGKWLCEYIISSYNQLGKEVKSKRKLVVYQNKPVQPNYSKSIDGSYEMISDVGMFNDGVTFLFKK